MIYCFIGRSLGEWRKNGRNGYCCKKWSHLYPWGRSHPTHNRSNSTTSVWRDKSGHKGKRTTMNLYLQLFHTRHSSFLFTNFLWYHLFERDIFGNKYINSHQPSSTAKREFIWTHSILFLKNLVAALTLWNILCLSSLTLSSSSWISSVHTTTWEFASVTFSGKTIPCFSVKLLQVNIFLLHMQGKETAN